MQLKLTYLLFLVCPTLAVASLHVLDLNTASGPKAQAAFITPKAELLHYDIGTGLQVSRAKTSTHFLTLSGWDEAGKTLSNLNDRNDYIELICRLPPSVKQVTGIDLYVARSHQVGPLNIAVAATTDYFPKTELKPSHLRGEASLGTASLAPDIRSIQDFKPVAVSEESNVVSFRLYAHGMESGHSGVKPSQLSILFDSIVINGSTTPLQADADETESTEAPMPAEQNSLLNASEPSNENAPIISHTEQLAESLVTLDLNRGKIKNAYEPIATVHGHAKIRATNLGSGIAYAPVRGRDISDTGRFEFLMKQVSYSKWPNVETDQAELDVALEKETFFEFAIEFEESVQSIEGIVVHVSRNGKYAPTTLSLFTRESRHLNPSYSSTDIEGTIPRITRFDRGHRVQDFKPIHLSHDRILTFRFYPSHWLHKDGVNTSILNINKIDFLTREAAQ